MTVVAVPSPRVLWNTRRSRNHCALAGALGPSATTSSNWRKPTEAIDQPTGGRSQATNNLQLEEATANWRLRLANWRLRLVLLFTCSKNLKDHRKQYSILFYYANPAAATQLNYGKTPSRQSIAT